MGKAGGDGGKCSSTLQGPWSVLGAVVTQSSVRLRVSKPTRFQYALVCQVLKGF